MQTLAPYGSARRTVSRTRGGDTDDVATLDQEAERCDVYAGVYSSVVRVACVSMSVHDVDAP